MGIESVRNLRVDWLFLLLSVLTYLVALPHAQEFARICILELAASLSKVLCNMHIEEIVNIPMLSIP